MHYQAVLSNYPIISEQMTLARLRVVVRELDKVLASGVPGDVTEFGCYAGTTSIFLQALLDAYGMADTRTLHVYDSFAGLPEKTAADESPVGVDFQGGTIKTSKGQLLHNFQRQGLRPPRVHKGWFKDLSAGDVPDVVAYAFLDGDFYESIRDSLRLVWPRLSPDGVITIDDYDREHLPGVTRAVTEFFQNKPVEIHHESNIAVISRSHKI